MSYIRPCHAMRHVDGVSEDYVFSDGFQIVDYGKVTDAGLIEMLGRYFLTRKYGRDDMFEKYIMQRLAARMDVKLRPRPLSKREWDAEEGKLWRAAHKEVKTIRVVGKKEGKASRSSLQQKSIREKVEEPQSVSTSVVNRFTSYTSAIRPGLSAKSR